MLSRNSVIWLLILAVSASCGKTRPDEEHYLSSRELTVLIGTDGYGDGSYNDTMLSGILGFCKDHPDVNLSLQQPESIADAGKRLDAWLSKEGSGDRALILASNTYEEILKGKSAPKNGRVLILETDDVFPGHSSYVIRRYGASWLCGAMSRSFVGVIFKAMDGNDMIEESARGFADGHGAVSDQETHTWTLANGPEGFGMRDSTWTAPTVSSTQSIRSFTPPENSLATFCSSPFWAGPCPVFLTIADTMVSSILPEWTWTVRPTILVLCLTPCA